MTPRPLLRLSSLALAPVLAAATASAQCSDLVFFEDFESGAVGWTTTLDWLISNSANCGVTCIVGQRAHIPFNTPFCACEPDPPPTYGCNGELRSPWVTLPSLAPGETLALDFCADMYMNFGNGGGIENCHRLLLRSCSGASNLYLLGGAGFSGGPCAPNITTPPIDLAAFQGQCVQLTFIAGEAETHGGLGRSRFQLDNVSIVHDKPAPASYCTSLPNSSGASAQIATSGSTSIAQNDLVLNASGCPPGQIGLYFFGTDQVQLPFGNGLLCVSGGVERLIPATVIQPDGTATKQVDNTAAPAAGKLVPGSSWNFQFWFRDPAGGGSGYNLTDGVSARFCQ